MPPGTTARVVQSTKAKSLVATSSTTQGGGGTSASTAKRKKRKSREGSQSTKKRSSTASSASASTSAAVKGEERRGSRRVSTHAQKSKRSSGSRSRRSSSRSSRRSRRSSSERRSQILYEEARREYEEGENYSPDCCNNCIIIAVKVIHIIDIAAGLTLLIYGFVVSGQPNAPSEAVAILISYGFVYVMTSALGIIGFNTTYCQRYGLIISAYGGVLIGCMEFISIICIAAMKDEFFDYLHDNRKALLMSEQTVNNLEKSFGGFVFISLFCAVIEVCRFFMLSPLQESLLQSEIDVETKKQQRSHAIVSRDSTEELNQLLTELAEPLLSQQQVPSSKRKSSNTTRGSSNKGKQGGRRRSPHDFTTSSSTNISKTGSVRSMSLQPTPTNPQTFGLTSTTTAVAAAATAAASRATSLPTPSSSSGGNGRGGNWFTRSLGLGGRTNEAEAANVQDNHDDDDDEEEYRTRATSSPDEFAPVDETISTEDLWWSHTERDEKMDMSWLEDVDDIHNNEERRRRRRGRGGGGGGGRGRRPTSSPQSDAERATLKPKVHFGDV